MNDNAAVEEVGAGAFFHRGEVVMKLGREGVRCDFAVLAADVSNLTFLWPFGIARRILAADEGVEVG